MHAIPSVYQHFYIIIIDLCIDGHFRLTGGRDMYEGTVEICSNGVWGTIYHGGWDSRDATVICRQLGRYQPYSSMPDSTSLLYNNTKINIML